MCRTRSDRKMNAPLSTATRCRPSGIVAPDLARPARRRASESGRRRAGSRTGVSSGIGRDSIPAMKQFEIITEADARVLARGETVDAGAARPRHAARARHAAGAARHGRARGTASRPTTRRWRRRPTSGRVAIAQRPHRRGAAARRSWRFCAAAAWRSTISAPTAPTRWTIRTSRRRWRARSRAARPTPASSSTAPASARPSPPTRSRGVRAAMATTETIARYSREHNGANVLTLGATLVTDDEARAIVDDVARHADARAALHPAAGEDSRPRSDRPDDRTHDTRRAAAPHRHHRRRNWRRPAPRPRPRAARCHSVLDDCCPDRLRGVIDAGATRVGVHATRRRAGGVASMIDHTLLKPDATRQEIEDALPRGGAVQVRDRLRQPDLGGHLRPAAGGQRRRRLLGRRVSARRDDGRRQGLRDAARDLRRRARDRHGHQRRRAQVRRPARPSSATSRR